MTTEERNGSDAERDGRRLIGCDFAGRGEGLVQFGDCFWMMIEPAAESFELV